ncbi:N-acetylmuramoyl-L-alanine amidase [Neogemmobacter tilapiae]|uniref:N-acetylmuramoyl-L-alanine amidase n=1 Tax=Neogemmobacter tilapiae TaxID=875041 RepID=A0A918TQM2_9RHOB|nr:N-acetylmuramoyl-L-alanine amidase [Gemmobacter tilapiae]GHC58878.1 N-acetylmuramoyl-L-alanine amidase [Gemmobacter tilapiae]
MIRIFLAFLLAVWAGFAQAQELSALARFDATASGVKDEAGLTQLRLTISQPVAWRVRVLDNPPRVVIDTREVDWKSVQSLDGQSPNVTGLRAGPFRPGWSRLVLTLARPMAVQAAQMQTDGPVQINLTLGPIDPKRFAELAALPEPLEWALPEPTPLAELPKDRPFVVMLDPGHGGIDPGAERDSITEAELMLTFARELRDVLRGQGVRVELTREEDIFVPLEARISAARAKGASVFVSLHADALAEGEAVGATVYTLSEEASDAASQALAERHDRDDLLAGIDLTEQDDVVAGVLMDMARTETAPRTARLALALETAIKSADLKMHRHARQEAGFSVLKSPDIPSVLVEIGFLSSTADFKRINDKEWRAEMALAIADGLKVWADEDAALRALRNP